MKEAVIVVNHSGWDEYTALVEDDMTEEQVREMFFETLGTDKPWRHTDSDSTDYMVDTCKLGDPIPAEQTNTWEVTRLEDTSTA